ncbi:MAG: DUF3261 domain-containing protein [Parvibaculum sp.]|uniref:DUF3261 domain-containing protein n=1 Tax=Parvibaculum sp. TaxID=2024848 RepID=UPI002AB9B563|nr:DUF3261 domain-containing protein [Parvibaculum sp.]MDZ4381305.1 DUF3261 domain-containing protein [Parvibaculum sp.]
MRLVAFLLFCLAVLTGCGAPGGLPARERLAPGVQITLPRTSPFAGEIEAAQLVEVNRGGRRDRFDAFVEGGEERFTLAMTVPSGPSLMTVDWREGSLVVRRGLAPDAIDAERILADFMLVYAPEAVLRAAVSGGDLVFSGGGVRRIFRNGELLIEARAPEGNPWQGEARLVNFVYDYALTIESRSPGPQ